MLHEIDLSRADLNLLVLFEAVLEEGHVGRAAERLSLSPSAVSHGLGRLRRMLNDPLFLKHPKGVSPTGRALELAGPIREVLAQVRSVIAAAEPFDPLRSTRRFQLGAPDGILGTALAPLLERVRREAPGVDFGVRLLLPQDVLAALDARDVDVAITPVGGLPARIASRPIYEDHWVVALRAGHPLHGRLDLDGYCQAAHVVVSMIGDPVAFTDQALAEMGRSRRVALVAPNILLGLAVVAASDLLILAPAKLALAYASPFGLVWDDPPLALDSFQISSAAPVAALADDGVAWLLDVIQAVAAP